MICAERTEQAKRRAFSPAPTTSGHYEASGDSGIKVSAADADEGKPGLIGSRDSPLKMGLPIFQRYPCKCGLKDRVAGFLRLPEVLPGDDGWVG